MQWNFSLRSRKPEIKDFGECVRFLEDTFGKHFERLGYFEIPGGFAAVTGLEQITDDGCPDLNSKISNPVVTSRFESFIRSISSSLFSSEHSRSRVVLIAISSEPFKSDKRATSETITTWIYESSNALPIRLRQEELSPNHTLSILIYEFTVKVADHSIIQQFPTQTKNRLDCTGFKL